MLSKRLKKKKDPGKYIAQWFLKKIQHLTLEWFQQLPRSVHHYEVQFCDNEVNGRSLGT